MSLTKQRESIKTYMPPNVRVIIFDDDEIYRDYLASKLEGEGHTVVGTAGSIHELEELLKQGVKADVALLDNQAPWNDGEAPDYKGVGKIAEKRIFQYLGENVITVSITSTEAKYGDHHFHVDDGIDQIGEFVTSLPNKER